MQPRNPQLSDCRQARTKYLSKTMLVSVLSCQDVMQYEVNVESHTSIAILSRARCPLFEGLFALSVFILFDTRWRKIMGRPGARQAFGGSFWGRRLAQLPLPSSIAQAAS